MLDDAIVKRSRVAGANLGSEPSADQAVLTAALQLGHNYVGTEHILLACDQEPEPMITVVLDEMGARAAVIRERVIAALHGSS